MPFLWLCFVYRLNKYFVWPNDVIATKSCVLLIFLGHMIDFQQFEKNLDFVNQKRLLLLFYWLQMTVFAILEMLWALINDSVLFFSPFYDKFVSILIYSSHLVLLHITQHQHSASWLKESYILIPVTHASLMIVWVNIMYTLNESMFLFLKSLTWVSNKRLGLLNLYIKKYSFFVNAHHGLLQK